MPRPQDLRYTPTHEWVRVDGGVATVGITDYAVEQLGDLAFVDLPQEGESVEKDARFGEIESTKTVSDLISPVSGEIVAVHGEVADHLDLIMSSPFGEGWLVKIRMSHPEELASLLDAAGYEAHLEMEDQR